MVSPEGLQHEQFNPQEPGDRDEASALRTHFEILPGYLLWVSNFYAYKQADLLLAAYARLSASERAESPLVMVGGGWKGGLEAARSLTARLGVADNVQFLGWVDDAWLAPLYRNARAFVLASREETFGRCVIEAMACGTPCVVNDMPIMREVTGGHAVLVRFADTAAAGQALQTLLADEGTRARLRSEGIAWAKQFSFDRLAAERIEAIRDMLEGKPCESFRADLQATAD